MTIARGREAEGVSSAFWQARRVTAGGRLTQGREAGGGPAVRPLAARAVALSQERSSERRASNPSPPWSWDAI